MASNIDKYLSGQLLYGDDLSPEEILIWYRDESEGYADLGASDFGQYQYVYHALNSHHAFRHLNLKGRIKVLGFGSAYGEELLPILNQAERLVIVDPSDAFSNETVFNVPCRYIKPNPSGILDLHNNEFDLVTAFGVLHHIPNVTQVMHELNRVLKPGGYLLLREPIVSMGDWRKPRRGLTRHERGIPLPILQSIIQKSGFEIIREGVCVFPPLLKFYKFIRSDVFNSRLATAIDGVLSWIFSWNINYHPAKWWQKIRPTSAFYVLRKLPEENNVHGLNL